MTRFSDLQTRICKAYEPSWNVESSTISKSYDSKYRYFVFDLTVGKSFCDIYDKTREVYSTILGEGFGVGNMEFSNMNTVNPQVVFKVWDKEVEDESAEQK